MTARRQPTRQTESRLSTGSHLFFLTSEVACLFRVSSRTISRWVYDGLLPCRFQYCGGTFYRRVFLAEEIDKLIESFPSQADLDCDHPPGPRKQRVESILRIKRMHQLYSSRARAIRMTKRLAKAYGIPEGELNDNENAEPATLDRESARRWNAQPERPSDLGRDRSGEGWQDSWNDDEEGKG